MTDVSRRSLIKTSGLVLAGAAVADTTGVSLFSQSSQPRPLNISLLNGVHDSIASAAANISSGNGTGADYALVANQTNILLAQLVSANFDAGIKATASQTSAQDGDFSANGMADLIYNAIQAYAPNYPYWKVMASVQNLPQMNPNLPPTIRDGITNASLASIRGNGATPYITNAYNTFDTYSTTPPQQSGDCQELNFIMYFLGIIALMLAVMCALPEPAVVVICPAAAVIGIVVGILALVIGIFCP